MSKREEEERIEQMQMEVARIKLPRGREVFGLIEQRLGASRLRVRCFDNKTRICRIPGRLKRRLWVRENDIVVVEPWEYCGEEKGDIVFKYTPTQTQFLKNKGYLRELDTMDEF